MMIFLQVVDVVTKKRNTGKCYNKSVSRIERKFFLTIRRDEPCGQFFIFFFAPIGGKKETLPYCLTSSQKQAIL